MITYKNANLPMLEEITIHMDTDITQYIESADLIGQGLLDDTQVIADWQSFINTVMVYINTHEQLELVYDKPGKPLRQATNVPGSYYYYIGVRNEEGKFVGTVVVDFRLSTHTSTDTSGKDSAKHEANALTIIQKQYPNAKTIVPKGKVVNKKEFKDYDDAKRAIIGVLDSIVKKYAY